MVVELGSVIRFAVSPLLDATLFARPIPMPLTNQQAEQELYTNNYNVWRRGTTNASNAPAGCSQITQATATFLRRTWNPNSAPNSWNQSNSTGFRMRDQGITRWVTRSVSGGSDVVDFHALWNGVTFLRHFRIVP